MPDLALYSRCTEEYHHEENSWDIPSECMQESFLEDKDKEQIHQDFEEKRSLLLGILDQLTEEWYKIARIEGLERQILLLKKRCDQLERTAPMIVPIESFTPEPYGVIKPFHIVVKFHEDQYIAAFFDANLATSGDTQEEAVLNLKDLIVSMFEMLNEMNNEQLGPEPLRQKQLLCEFIQMKV